MGEKEGQGETTPNEGTGEEGLHPVIPWATFLEEYPTDSVQDVSDYFYEETQYGGEQALYKSAPILRLYCAQCEGIRNFDGEWGQTQYKDAREPVRDFLVYECRDCKAYRKTYCLYSGPKDNQGNYFAVKIGEYPALNTDIPSSLPGLLGEDYPYFIKGLKCEEKGLGVGAYAYYRRVVENQKDRMLREILRVAQKLSAKPDQIDAIDKASKETQFAKAVDMVKGMLPETLLVDGHNPFKLIHTALSIGIHEESDETCLQLAHDIRLVLTDLAERIKLALTEQRELKGAVSSLMKFNQEHK